MPELEVSDAAIELELAEWDVLGRIFALLLPIERLGESVVV